MLLSVDAAIGEVRERSRRHWLGWARGEDIWPLKLKLGAPKGAWFDSYVIETLAWAAEWQSAIADERIPGRLDFEARRARRLGTHQLPTHWIVDDVESALSMADPQVVADYRRAAARFSQALECSEVVWKSLHDIPVRNAKTIAGFDDADWAAALTTASHLVRVGTGDATVLRQISIPGVHSKWIEQNATLLCATLGVPGDTDGADPLTRLTAHLGLDAKQTRLQVTLACPRLRAQAAGLRRFHSTIPILNETELRPQVILIVENEAPGHSMNTDLDEVAVIGGLGAGAPILAQLNWIHGARRVLYWGDIDRAGISILATLRRAGVEADSLLMDERVLDDHPDGWHTTGTQVGSDSVPVGLTPEEFTLYRRLTTYHAEHGSELQLEQEHLPKALVDKALRESVSD